MTKQLQRTEDELDSAESRLGTITEQLKLAEAQADESERSELQFCYKSCLFLRTLYD